MLTAIEKVRQILTGKPLGEPRYLHDGPNVVRWITGGNLPDMKVRYHQHGNMLDVRCAKCDTILGTIGFDHGPGTAEKLAEMRLSGHGHSMDVSFTSELEEKNQ